MPHDPQSPTPPDEAAPSDEQALPPPQTAAAASPSPSALYPELELSTASHAPPPRSALAGELGRADFPVALRGYDRAAVEAYVARVVSTVADLEATRSPEGAVKRALDQVGAETSGILQRAQQAAEEMTSKAHTESERRVREAEAEAQNMVRDAETRTRELDADNDALWAQRRRLVEDLRGLAGELMRVADEAVERLPPPPGRAGAIIASRAGPAEHAGVANGAPATDVGQPTEPFSPLDLPDGDGPPV